MRDFDLRMRESRVRREIAENAVLLPKLFALKQADFSACKDDPTRSPTVAKWETILAQMKREGAPLSLSELAVNGKDFFGRLPPSEIGGALNEFFRFCIQDGARNERKKLLARIERLYPEET